MVGIHTWLRKDPRGNLMPTHTVSAAMVDSGTLVELIWTMGEESAHMGFGKLVKALSQCSFSPPLVIVSLKGSCP